MQLGNPTLTIEDVIEVARHGRAVPHLDPTTPAYQRILASRRWVEQVLASNDRAYYGINTGFGIKAGRVPLETAEIPWLSRNLIVSHASGVGPSFHPEVVRAAMLLRAHSLAQGYSGVRPQLIETLVQMLNEGVTPLVPELGSVGSSGDLAPLSHLALVISERPTTHPERALPPNLPSRLRRKRPCPRPAPRWGNGRIHSRDRRPPIRPSFRSGGDGHAGHSAHGAWEPKRAWG